MSRRASRTDRNQAEIVAEFRRLGADVLHMHTLGHGAPDLAVGYRGLTVLVEIKDGTKSPSRRALTDDEQVWHDTWTGAAAIVRSTADVSALLDQMSRASLLLAAGGMRIG